ncbi:MAG TPA: hypothetical protein VF066_16240 [Thermoleophilaceae bacterium]
MTGTLLGQSIVLTGPFQPGSVFDGSYTGFSDSRFTPSLASTDFVTLDVTPGTSYALDFGAPVENPTLHLATIASILRFPTGTVVEKVSGEATLTVSGNTVTGQVAGSTDSNGTVRIVGTYSSLPFTADPNFGGSNPVDGILVQVGGSTPPPAPPPSESPAPPTANDPPPTPSASDPPPEAGKTVDMAPQNGTVKVQRPGETSFSRISDTVVIPVGSLVDASEGTVRITSAADTLGNTQAGLFYGGIFQVLQAPGLAPVTELVLRGGSFAPCRRIRSASAAARAKPDHVVRQLWGNATGSFRTRGRYASATVRGTIWRTADRCDGTAVSVRRGSVTVTDFTLRRTLPLGAPRTYVARAR